MQYLIMHLRNSNYVWSLAACCLWSTFTLWFCTHANVFNEITFGWKWMWKLAKLTSLLWDKLICGLQTNFSMNLQLIKRLPKIFGAVLINNFWAPIYTCIEGILKQSSNLYKTQGWSVLVMLQKETESDYAKLKEKWWG